ncbi:hypothetical protein LOC68_11815 [Blastopirellula sp. JC732]|uniref:Uncharacterized protein n=1 Tax=Blastopirellula sediminis TaxID=2894196 RepID=A0A9X1MMS4_9BACT|nr:hypothetical protein [Blastopirellula sediminis]MCC9607622.1 hypothetical protein [Blastopirellula sediminis]MCC9629085.1 hypothetical protein [Blastopirellula sediminis]
MNLLSLLMIGAGFVVEVLGVLFCVVNSGDAGINMPLLFGFLAIGSLLTVGGVFWHILSKRL